MDIVKLKVRGFHCDFQRHVNHTRYLEFMEEGTWDYWDHRPDLVRSLIKNKVDHSIVNLNINYRRSARLGDALRVETRLARARRNSIVFEQKILMDQTGELVTEAELTVVFYKAGTGENQSVDSDVFKDWADLRTMLREGED